MTARVPASDRTRKRIADVLSGDFDKSDLLRNAVRLIIEEALEAEVTDVLGRDYYERGEPAGYRTGRVTIETGRATFDAEYCATNPGFVLGDYVMLAVSDDGCGMDPETLSNIFEPFFTTKGLGKGTGLGLATVYGIVKQNHGFINAYSEPGRGTTFKIYLPVHQAGTGRATQQSTTPTPARGNETILLVEDEPAILAVGTKILERQGYTVLAAASPDEAMRLAREHAGDIHLLITDVVMPKMNGRELARHLLARYPDLKCLFMSGYTASVIAHHGVLDADVHFLQKPFSIQDLATKVRTAVEISELHANDG